LKIFWNGLGDSISGGGYRPIIVIVVVEKKDGKMSFKKQAC
jgi:hypothetical protein